MKFFTSALILSLVAVAQAACRVNPGDGVDTRCCWGGGGDGASACLRQNGASGCVNGAQTRNFCSRMNSVVAKCNADCCDIATGRGQPCPKGKNRCDDDSGCPYRAFPGGQLQ